MTTIRKASGHTPDGNHVWDVEDYGPVPSWADAITRMYDEAKATIADDSGTWSEHEVAAWAEYEDEPWPETREIDLDTMTPPAAFQVPTPEPAIESPDAAPAEAPARPRRAWRRWFPGR